MAGNETNKVLLNICGVELAIKTEKSQDYTELLASELEANLKKLVSMGVPLVKASLLLNISGLDDAKELDKQISSLNERIDKLETENKSEEVAGEILAQKASLQAELDSVKNDLDEEKNSSHAVEEALKKAETERSALQAEIESLRVQLESAQKSSDEILSQLQNQDTDGSFQELLEENERLSALNAELEEKLSGGAVSEEKSGSQVVPQQGNPMRRVFDDTNLTAFYEKKD